MIADFRRILGPTSELVSDGQKACHEARTEAEFGPGEDLDKNLDATVVFVIPLRVSWLSGAMGPSELDFGENGAKGESDFCSCERHDELFDGCIDSSHSVYCGPNDGDDRDKPNTVHGPIVKPRLLAAGRTAWREGADRLSHWRKGEEKVRKGEVGADESYAIAGERRGCEGAREEEDRRAKNLRTVGRSLLG